MDIFSKIRDLLLNKKQIENYDTDYNRKIVNDSTYIYPHQIDIIDLFSLFQSKDFFHYYIGKLNEIKYDLLYKSDLHGKSHNHRVLIFVLYLAYTLKLNKEDTDVLFYASMYHDIGRIDDFEDSKHGLRGVNTISQIMSEYKDISILQAVIQIHSIKDNQINIQRIIDKYKLDKDRFISLYSILKDADALDRVRISYGYDESSLDPTRLRLSESKCLIKAAHQLYEYQVKIDNNVD